MGALFGDEPEVELRVRVTLNGWQRLGVVVTGLWILLVLTITYASWPGPRSGLRALEAEWAIGTDAERQAALDGMEREIYVPDPPPRSGRHILTGGELARAGFSGNWGDPQWGIDVGRELVVVRQALRDERVVQVQQTLMVCVIPPVFLYAFGWMVGWIRRGFRG